MNVRTTEAMAQINNPPKPATEAERNAMEAVAQAGEALNIACAKLAKTLEPVAAVEAERHGTGAHPLELLLKARAQAEHVAEAIGILQRSGLHAGAEVLAQQQAFDNYSMRQRQLIGQLAAPVALTGSLKGDF